MGVCMRRLTVACSFAASMFLLSVFPALAQAQGVLTHPEVSRPVRFAISQPVRDMMGPMPLGPAEEAESVRYPKLGQLMAGSRLSTPAGDGALQKEILPAVSATIGLNLVGVGTGFGTYRDPDAPPDTNGAIGDTQIVEWVNVQYAVFDKTTGALIAGPINGNTFWSGLGGSCAANNDGDIIAQWDKIAHRWVMQQNVFASPYQACIAISTTADATGSYYQYDFADSEGFPDYPKLGVFVNGVNNAYFTSDNNFGPGGGGFVGAHPCAYQRDKMLTGDPSAIRVCFQTGTFDDSLLPSDQDSTIPPPTGADEVYLGSIDNGDPNNSNVIYAYKFHVDFTTPANSTFTGAGGTMPITVANFALACGGFGACINQPTGGYLLDSLGDRLMYRLSYRRFLPPNAVATALAAPHESWLVTHSVTNQSVVGARWYEFRDYTNHENPRLTQQGTVSPDSNHRWMGSIAQDKLGNIALGYSVSSGTVFPSVSFTGRVPTDPLGTMESEAPIVVGGGSQLDTSNRWGDYSSMALDNDGCTFLYSQEYYMTTGSFNWSTQVATLKFPTCH